MEWYSGGREEVEKIRRFKAASGTNEPNLFFETNIHMCHCWTYSVSRHVAVNTILLSISRPSPYYDVYNPRDSKGF